MTKLSRITRRGFAMIALLQNCLRRFRDFTISES